MFDSSLSQPGTRRGVPAAALGAERFSTACLLVGTIMVYSFIPSCSGSSALAGSVLNAEVTGMENVAVAALREWRGWWGGTGLVLFQDLQRHAEAPCILCFLFFPPTAFTVAVSAPPGGERKRTGSCRGDPISNGPSVCDGPGVIERGEGGRRLSIAGA